MEMIDLGAGLGYAAEPAPQTTLFNVTERSELAVATYQALGLVADSGKASEAIAEQMQSLHDGLVADQTTEDVETFKPVDFTGAFTLRALLGAYNRMQRQDGTTPLETYVWGDLWDQYKTTELNRRLLDDQAQPVAAIQARGMLLGGDKPGVPGLYFVSQNLKDQIKRAEAFMGDYDKTHQTTAAAVMNTADLVVVNAQRQVEGRPLLDNETEYTFSRVPQLGTKSVDRGSIVGFVHSDGGRLRLRGSYGHADGSDGVRLSVGPKQA